MDAPPASRVLVYLYRDTCKKPSIIEVDAIERLFLLPRFRDEETGE